MDDARSKGAAQNFGSFTLVPARCARRGPDGRETVLRPKTYAVLNELLAHRGQVVTREALIAVVWPGVTIGDEGLTQCVREVRVALGPDGPDMIRTLPKRGYMLDLGGNENASAVEEPHGPESVPLRHPAPPARRWRWVVPAAAAPIVLGMIAWSLTSSSPRPPQIPSRVQAEQLIDRANHWHRSEVGAAAWRGQRDLYARAVAIDPDQPAGWVGLALTNANLIHYRHSDARAQDLEAAEAAAQRAYALAPNSAEANAAVAAVDRLRPERLELSLAGFQRAFELDPSDYSMRAQLGWMMAQLGRAEDGDGLLRAALVAAPPGHPFRPSWYYYLGMIDLLLGRGDHGVGWLRQAQASGGGAYLDAHRFDVTMAAALAQAGQSEAAAVQLRDILARQPDLTLEKLRTSPPWGSGHPVFKAQLERVFEGLSLAGLR